MEQERIEDAIEKLLRSVDRPGDFCVHGRLFAPMPRLEVEGAGALAFPVPEAQIRALIRAAERAPYGKGTKTLVDRSVRDCWQIEPERVRLAGAAWRRTFGDILRSVAAGLGCALYGRFPVWQCLHQIRRPAASSPLAGSLLPA